MDKKLWEEIEGTVKPSEKGHYRTDHGVLYHDGRGFVVPGHKNVTYTSVEWWLKPYTPSTKQDD